jgi:hypothetical protein
VSRKNTGATPLGGCLAFLAIVIAIATIAMAIISLSALFDPFNWMPTVHRVWQDCEGDCALAHRFPGFWWHAIANLLYGTLAVAAAILFGARVIDLREARAARYESLSAESAYRGARRACRQVGATLAALALIAVAAALL